MAPEENTKKSDDLTSMSDVLVKKNELLPKSTKS